MHSPAMLADSSAMLTIFYDAHCPLCYAEMQHLKKHDHNHFIRLIDIHQDNFSNDYPNIPVDKAMKILHATYQSRVLLGLQVTHKAWTLVGKGFWVAPLNWPVCKQIAHLVYLFVAQYRHSISAFLAPKLGISLPNCKKGTCYANTNSNNRRQ